MTSSAASAPAADPTRRRGAAAIVAVLAAACAFALYRATLLPGFDFGDTGSFQTTVGSPIITTRDGYPLYFAIGGAALWIHGGDPAHVLNLVSAIEASVAVGLFVLVAFELCGSVAASAAGALLFATSYTFWSQSIIADVYALHLTFVLLTAWVLLRWQRRPSTTALALFFACYALGFGNHLSMVLLLPAYTLFLLVSAPGGWKTMVRARIVVMATAIAAAGALQYVWNIRTLWIGPQPPASFWSGLQTFWFDVTKSDWRDTMVLRVPESMLRDHLSMYWFDLTQQFGRIVPLLAVVGAVLLWRRDWRRALLLVAAYAVNVAFAFSYNVGDAHVFYLPSHLIVALLATAAIGLSRVSIPRPMALGAAALLAAYAAGRGYRDYPALDRSADRRPSAVIASLTRGIDDRHSILIADLNWQIANGLSYYAKVVRPEVAVARMPEVIAYAPALVQDNDAAGRRVFLTDRANRELAAAYGPLLPSAPDPAPDDEPLAAQVQRLDPGTRYVLCVLRPSRDLALDSGDVAAAVRILTGGAATLPAGDYAAIAGRVGSPPILDVGCERPFSTSLDVGGVATEVRMESWLASDTIRRMGFGHVIADRRHTLIVERGVSFVAFDEGGQPLSSVYAANLFAPQRRYVVTPRQQR